MKKFFAIGNLPIFIEAETFDEAVLVLAEAIDLIKDEGPEIINEVNTKVVENVNENSINDFDKSKLN